MCKKVYFLLFCFLLITASSQNTQQLFKTYLQKGFDLHDNRKLDSAKIYLEKVDSLQTIIKDSSAYYQKEILVATLLIRDNKSADAFIKLLKCERYFKQQKDSANIGLTFLKLGVANYYIGRRLITQDNMKEGLQYKNHLSKKVVTRMYRNIGSVDLEEGMGQKNDSLFKSSISYYNKAIKIYKEENWLDDLALTTSLLAESYIQLGNYEKALIIINEAIEISKKSQNNSQIGFALIKKASILRYLKQYDEVFKNLVKAEEIFKKSNEISSLEYVFIEKRRTYIKLQQYKKANELADDIINFRQQQYKEKFTKEVSEMEAKYKTAEKEREIAQQKEEILEQQLKINTRNLSTILFGSAFLILGIISFGYYNRSKFIKKQLEKEIELKDALATIKTQNRLQEQRLRISRDLHDNIGSQLTFIISSLDNLKFVSKDVSEKFKDKITNISSFTVETIHQLRDTIWAMNKSEITTEDFYTRLLTFIEKAKSATNNSINFKLENSVKDPIIFTSMQGINLFRSIQEALNNAIKYADASTITLTSKLENNTLHITIKDNGKGFELKHTELGNGLSNIEHRMSEINGKAVITSKVGIGTQIELQLPV